MELRIFYYNQKRCLLCGVKVAPWLWKQPHLMVMTKTFSEIWRMKMNEIYAIPGYPIIDACACARLNPLKRRGGKQTILISVTLDVQTFASRKFRECQNSRNFWHKLSRMRHKNLFREHKLSRIDAFILYFPEKIKQKRRKNEE